MVNPAGQSSRVAVTGTAAINGGTVTIAGAPGTYVNDTIYTILTAAAGRTGAFSGVDDTIPGTRALLGYDPNDVFVQLLAIQGPIAQTFNQKSVANYLDTVNVVPGSDLEGVLIALGNLPPAQARGRFRPDRRRAECLAAHARAAPGDVPEPGLRRSDSLNAVQRGPWHVRHRPRRHAR
jgi:hypothetical protein